MPFFKRFTNVCADPDFHVDLITGDHCNVWEPPLRQFTGTMQTYKWLVLEDHFNIEVVADSAVDAYEQSRRVVASLATLCGRPSPFEAESYQPSIERAGDSIAIARLKEAGRALRECSDRVCSGCPSERELTMDCGPTQPRSLSMAARLAVARLTIF